MKRKPIKQLGWENLEQHRLTFFAFDYVDQD